MPAAIFRMRTVVQIVVTPGSGEGRARCTTRRLRRALKRRGYEVRVQSFGSLGKLLEWSDSCEPDFSHLVAVGGDATLSAAAGASVRLSIPFVPVPNVETYRDYLSLTPTASPVDGVFDVFAISAPSRFRLWLRVLRLLITHSRRAEGMALARGRRVRVTVEGHAPEELTVLRRALPLLVLPESVTELEARQVEAETELAQS